MQGDGTGIYTPCCALGQGTRMGTHTMESSLLLCCLLALVIPAISLKCHTCVGDFNDCNPTEVTCPGKRDRCSTTALYIDSFPCKVRKVFKGCINSTTTSKKLSISPNDLITLSLQQDMCKSDLCNTQEVSDPDSNQNDLYCYSCITPGTSCDSETMKEMRCRGEQKQCLDMQVIGSFGEIADVNLKGCGQIPACKSNLYFSSQTSSVSIQCCNENYCNSGTETESEDKTPNGIQCYSCNTLDGAKCSPEEVVKAQCYGSLTYCLEVAGVNIKDEHPIPTVIKGCATKSMCDSSVLPLLQKLGTATVKCCKGSLCNNQFTESGLIASGYVPIGNDSPETGIQNTPSDATSSGSSRWHKHSDSPVKTGHHANNMYGFGCMPTSSSSYNNNNNNHGFSEFNGPNMSPGNSNNQGIKGGPWNSNSNSHYPNPSFNSYNEFSDFGSVHNPSIPTTQVDQGTSSNDLSVENPNSVYGSNVFSTGDQSTDNDGIFVDSESYTVSPINSSSGGDNVNTLSTGGSSLGGEDESDTANYSNTDDSSIPNALPTFPDIASYVDNSVSNSYYDNNVNDLNNNDFSSYESAGFTEVVLTDISLNDDQSSFSTVEPDGIVSNSYDSVGHSMSGHSADNDNNMNYPNNNDFNSYDSAGFTEVVYADIDWNDDQSSFTTVAPDSIVSNSYDSVGNPVSGSSADNDNNMNYPNNNDFSSYESAGFTDVVLTDIDLNDNQSSFSTVAPDGIVSNSYDSVGNSVSGYSDDAVNIGSNVNMQGNNDSVQHLTPATSKTHSYDINQQISGYGINAYNTAIANNNGSGNYISSSGNATAGSGNSSSAGTADIFTDSNSHNMSNLINYSSGEENLSTLSPKGSELGAEGVSDNTNYSNSDDSSIPDAPPTFPDFTSYDDTVTNSYFDNDMNYPNNNDFNSYESAGFTEVVYADIDWNDDQSSFTTVAPDIIVSNSYDSVGNSDNDNNMNYPNNNDFSSYESAGFTEVVYADVDWNDDQLSSPTVATDITSSYDSIGNSGSDNSAYNPNIVLTNNNETSGYSADIFNNGSNVYQQENVGSVKNFTPATPKTYNSDINQQISGYGNNIYNTDFTFTNGSRYNISSSGNNTAGSGNSSSAGIADIFTESEIHNLSSPINYSSGENNLNALSPGGGISDTTKYTNSDDSSFPNALPTFPDFPSYSDNSIFPNSYYDNNMNYPNNNEFNSYDSAGFTDVVYTDIEWNDDQSSFPTLATDNVVSNGYDSVGNPGSDNSAYKPNVISSANNNETSGYSADAVNMGSSVNVQINNGSVQHFTPATSKTHNSGIKQHISGYGTNIYNTGIATNNGSGNSISSSGNNIGGSGNNSSAGIAGIFNNSESNTVPDSINYSGGGNLSAVSPGGSALDGEGVSDTTNSSNNDNSSIPGTPATLPDFTSYGDDSIVSNSYYDNNMNYPNNNDFSSYEGAGFTEIAYSDEDWNNDQSSSLTVAPDLSSSYDSIGNSGNDNSAYNPNVLLTNKNETSGYSADIVNNGSHVNVHGNYVSVQNGIPATPKTYNSDINQQSSGYGNAIYNTGIAYTNGSGNSISSSGNNTAGSGNSSSAGIADIFTDSGIHNLSSPINYSSGENNLTALSPGGPGGGGVSDTTNYSNSDDSTIPDAPPTFPAITAFTSYGDNSIVPNSYYDNNMNYPNNNDFSNYEGVGFTEVAYSDIDWSDDQSSSPTVAPDIVSHSYDSVGNSGSDNSAYNTNIISSDNNNETSGYSIDAMNIDNNVNAPGNNGSVQHLTPATSKTHNSGIKQHISGYATNIYNKGIANNNGSGNYISSSGNNTAGSGNNSSAGTSGSSSFGGYTNMPGGNESSTTNTSLENDAEMTDEWNNSNHSSKDNIEVPLEYANSGNVTGMTNEWNNSNDSNHNLGYNNIFGNNNPSTSYTGNGTGMSNKWSKNNSSNHNMSVSGGYANNSGSNYSSISHTSSGIGTGMTNEWINNNHSYPNLVPPGGNYGSFNSNGSNNISNSNYSSNFMMPHNGSTYGNGNSSGSSWDSIESYLNHMSSGANNNGSYFNTSSWPSGSPPGKHSFSNETGWMYSLNNVLNAMPNNSNNGSSSNHNNIQNFLSTLNGYIHGNGSKNITEWIQNDSFFSNLMPPGMNHNGSAPSGYNINSLNNGTINDYFNRLGISLNNSNFPNIMSILSGGNNGSFNISKFASGWSNIMYNANLMNPHANHNGSPYSLESIPSNSGSSYSNIQNPNLLSPGGSTNTNGSYLGAGFNGQPSSNTNGMSSGGYHDGSINGNGHYSYVVPPGGDNTGAFFNNGSNSNMIPGVGSSGTSHGGASVDGNGYNSNLMGHGLNGSMLGNGSNSGGVLSNNYNLNELVPGRSTNDSAGGGGAGDENGSMFNSASSFWTKSWSIVIFSAIALMVLN